MKEKVKNIEGENTEEKIQFDLSNPEAVKFFSLETVKCKNCKVRFLGGKSDQIQLSGHKLHQMWS